MSESDDALSISISSNSKSSESSSSPSEPDPNSMSLEDSELPTERNVGMSTDTTSLNPNVGMSANRQSGPRMSAHVSEAVSVLCTSSLELSEQSLVVVERSENEDIDGDLDVDVGCFSFWEAA